ncbi:hypothetical protein GBF38_009460, partial [Nibea albiflora]
ILLLTVDSTQPLRKEQAAFKQSHHVLYSTFTLRDFQNKSIALGHNITAAAKDKRYMLIQSNTEPCLVNYSKLKVQLKSQKSKFVADIVFDVLWWNG